MNDEPILPEHDFPAVGSYIEIAFYTQHRENMKVLRHSTLMLKLLDPKDNQIISVPWHAVHWWKETLVLEIPEIPQEEEE